MMKRFIVVTDPAGTAARPSRVQAGRPDLLEPMDHLPDHVFVALDPGPASPPPS